MRKVYLDKQIAEALGSYADEVYPNETNIYLLSDEDFQGEKSITITDVRVLQTAYRKKTSVDHGNLAATRRVLGTILASDSNILGGYHSHPYPGNTITLSHTGKENDVDGIETEMKLANGMGFDLTRWIELIGSIRRWDYSHAHDSDLSIRQDGQNIRMVIKPDHRYGFHLTLGGYELYETDSGLLYTRVDLKLR